MDKAFQSFFTPGRHRVFGLELVPMQLGHLFLMFRYGLPPIASDSRDPGLLLSAVFILCQDWRKSEKDFGKWWCPLFSAFWGWKCRKMNIAEEWNKFSEYLAEQLSTPQTKMDPSAVRQLATPAPIRLLAACMGLMHMSRDESMDCRVVEASAVFTAWMELEEKLELWSDEDEDVWQRAQEMLRQERINSTN